MTWQPLGRFLGEAEGLMPVTSQECSCGKRRGSLLALATPKPGPHLLSLMHCRQLSAFPGKAQYMSALQVHTRFCCFVQLRVTTWSGGGKDSQGHFSLHSPALPSLTELVGASALAHNVPGAIVWTPSSTSVTPRPCSPRFYTLNLT